MAIIEIHEDGEERGYVDVAERTGSYDGDNPIVQAVVEDIDGEFVEVTNADEDEAEEGLPGDTERELTDQEVAQWAGGLLNMAGVDYKVEQPESDLKTAIAQSAGSLVANKARRYIDDPSEAPEWADVQEGPEGGLYYETDDEPGESESVLDDIADDLGVDLDDVETEEEDDGPDVQSVEEELEADFDDALSAVPEGYQLDQESQPLDAAIVDRGNGAELVDIELYDPEDGTVMLRPIDDPADAQRFVSDDEYDYYEQEDVLLYGEVDDEVDEFGRPENHPEIELQEPETRFENDEPEPVSFPDDDRDPFESREAAEEVHNKALDRLRDVGYDDESVERVDEELQKWRDGGYARNPYVWAAAMALTGQEKLPTQFDTNVAQSRFQAAQREEEVLAGMCDVMRLSRATAKAHHADEDGQIELYRGVGEGTLNEYVKHNDDGSLSIRPQALESWTVDDEMARDWVTDDSTRDPTDPDSEPDRTGIVIKQTVDAEKVGYYGPIALDRDNTKWQEMTLLHEEGETYTIEPDQAEFYDPAEYKMEKDDEEIPMLPVEATEWLRNTSDGEAAKASILTNLESVLKARRYVDHPTDVPEGYEVQEGPQGGIYYETDESAEEAGAGSYGRDELTEMVEATNYIVTDGLEPDDISDSRKGPFIIDMGDGPEIVQGGGVMQLEMDDDDEPRDYVYFDDASDMTPLEEIDVLAEIKPKRDEYGRLIDPQTIEVEKPESNPDFRTDAFDKDRYGDWHEDRDAADSAHGLLLGDIGTAYGEEVREEVEQIFDEWQMKGYNARAPLWEAAMAMRDDEVVPEHLTTYRNNAGIGETDEDVLAAICDIMRVSQETVREEFGDSFTVTRAIREETYRQYVKENDDGSIEIKPQALESWSHDSEGAVNWARHNETKEFGWDGYVMVEKEFSAEDVGFFGPLALGSVNESYKEITINPKEETYTIPAENVDRTRLSEKAADALEEPPRMPSHASDWMFEPDEDRILQEYGVDAEAVKPDTKSAILSELTNTLSKRRVYVDSPEEVPDQYEVQEGPQGGIFYETEPEEGDDEEEIPEEEGMREFEEMPDTREVDPLSSEEIRELDYGDYIWTVDPSTEEMVVAEVVNDDDLDAEFFQGGMMALPVGEDDEEAFSIYPQGEVYGLADESAIPGAVGFEDLEVGDEIWFEDEWYHDQAQGEVVDIYEVDDELRVRVEGPDGENFPVSADGSSGYTFDGLVGDDETNILSDDLTGAKIRFDTGEEGVVINGEGSGLHVEMLSGPNEGEDIYGVSRDSIDEVVESGEDDEHEIPDNYIPGPDKAEIDTSGGIATVEGDDEWVDEHAYIDQHLKVYDRREEEMVDAYVDSVNEYSGTARANMEGGGSFKVGESNRYDVVGAKPWDELDREEKESAAKRMFQNDTTKREIGDRTVADVRDNLFNEGSLTRAKDGNIIRDVVDRFGTLKNEVDRASCGGRRGGRSFTISVSENEDDETIAHELGHGIAKAYGYDYDENAGDDYGAYDLSHNYTEHADTGRWDGFIDWDLSGDSEFFEPEHYMLTQWDDDGNADSYAVGSDAFKDEIDAEIEERYKSEMEERREHWESLDYESPDDDTTALEVFESLEPGDVVQFEVPDWDAGRDDDGNPLDTEPDFGEFDRIMTDNMDRQVAVFEREDGGEWRWPLRDSGELNSDWSSVVGYAQNPQDGDDEESDSQGSGGIPVGQRADSLTEHLAERWDGFNPDAEAPEEKVENLMRAVNRSWYKQAKVHEATSDPVERQKVVMDTGYSATNAHETMAQLHHVMQTPTESNKQRSEDIFDEHPWLVLAYMDIWEPSPEILEEMQELLQALGIEL